MYPFSGNDEPTPPMRASAYELLVVQVARCTPSVRRMPPAAEERMTEMTDGPKGLLAVKL
jgi:hypothetical protein